MPSYVREESSHSVRVFWLEHDRLLEDIRRAAQEAGRENPLVKEIVLFGSLAERRAVPGSDADILIVLREDHRPFLERVNEWLEKFDLGFPVEVFPYTVAELNNPVAREALAKGVRLYASSRG